MTCTQDLLLTHSVYSCDFILIQRSLYQLIHLMLPSTPTIQVFIARHLLMATQSIFIFNLHFFITFFISLKYFYTNIYEMRYSQKPVYQEQGLLGKGSFAQVHKVRLQGKLYALKRIYNFHLKDPNYSTSIKRQIQIMERLDHPNIVKLIDIYQTQNSLQMLLQYLPEGNLYQKIKAQDRIPESIAKVYILDVVIAVKYLHSFPEPILHRDIKPQNILLTQDNRVKICDFGSANMVIPDHTRDSYVGTAQYMAPQMKQCKPHDQSLDLWSIGLLMYQLLTGSLPEEQCVYPEYMSRPAEDLIKKILVKEQNKRITINEIQQHIWFAAPTQTSQIQKFIPKSTIVSPQEMKQRIRQKNRLIKQKYLKKNVDLRSSIKQQPPMLANSSSLIAKAAEESALEYISELKNMHLMQQQVRQNQKVIEAQRNYNFYLRQLNISNQQLIKQKLDQLLQKNIQLQTRQLKSEQECKNALKSLILKLDKLKQYASYFPNYYQQKILQFSFGNQSIEPSDLPISEYLPKLKIKMLQLRRNSLIELKCIKKRRRQMERIFIQEPQRYQPYDNPDMTTQNILYKDQL